MRYIITIGCLFVFLENATSQEWQFTKVQRQMDGLYYQKDWKGVITYGDSALAHGVDYAQLRTQMGVSFVLEKRYFNAISSLEKALSLDMSNLLAREYLYYAYMALERPDDALRLTKGQSSEFIIYLGAKTSSALESSYLEGGVKLSNMPDTAGTVGFGSVTLNHRFSRNIALSHAFNIVQLKYRGNDIRQYGYVAQVPWSFANSWQLTLGGHFSTTKSRSERFEPYIPPPNQQPPRHFVNTTTENYYGGMISLQKHFGRWAIKPSVYAGVIENNSKAIIDIGQSPLGPQRHDEIDYHKQFGAYQLDLGVSWAPPVWGDRLRLGGEFVAQLSDGSPYFGGRVRLRVEATPKLYFTGEYARYGQMLNFMEGNGFVYHNSVAKLQNKVSLTTYWMIHKRVGLLFLAQMENRSDVNLKFNYYTFVAGLSYKF